MRSLYDISMIRAPVSNLRPDAIKFIERTVNIKL